MAGLESLLGAFLLLTAGVHGGKDQNSLWQLGLNIAGLSDKLETLKEVGEFLGDQKKEFLGTVDQQVKGLGSKLNAISDVVDDHALETFFAKTLPQLQVKNFVNTACIKGMKLTKKDTGELVMARGKLINLHRVKLLPKITKDLGKTTQQVDITFELSSMKLEFCWSYEPISIYGRSKEGTVEMLQRGPNRVKFVTTMSKVRSEIQGKIDKKECFVDVKSVEVQLGEVLTTTSVNYESTLKSYAGEGYTEQYVKEIIRDFRPVMNKSIKKTIMILIQPIFTQKHVFCENNEVIPVHHDYCKSLRKQ